MKNLQNQISAVEQETDRMEGDLQQEYQRLLEENAELQRMKKEREDRESRVKQGVADALQELDSNITKKIHKQSFIDRHIGSFDSDFFLRDLNSIGKERERIFQAFMADAPRYPEKPKLKPGEVDRKQAKPKAQFSYDPEPKNRRQGSAIAPYYWNLYAKNTDFALKTPFTEGGLAQGLRAPNYQSTAYRGEGIKKSSNIPDHLKSLSSQPRECIPEVSTAAKSKPKTPKSDIFTGYKPKKTKENLSKSRTSAKTLPGSSPSTKKSTKSKSSTKKSSSRSPSPNANLQEKQTTKQIDIQPQESRNTKNDDVTMTGYGPFAAQKYLRDSDGNNPFIKEQLMDRPDNERFVGDKSVEVVNDQERNIEDSIVDVVTGEVLAELLGGRGEQEPAEDRQAGTVMQWLGPAGLQMLIDMGIAVSRDTVEGLGQEVLAEIIAGMVRDGGKEGDISKIQEEDEYQESFDRVDESLEKSLDHKTPNRSRRVEKRDIALSPLELSRESLPQWATTGVQPGESFEERLRKSEEKLNRSTGKVETEEREVQPSEKDASLHQSQENIRHNLDITREDDRIRHEQNLMGQGISFNPGQIMGGSSNITANWNFGQAQQTYFRPINADQYDLTSSTEYASTDRDEWDYRDELLSEGEVRETTLRHSHRSNLSIGEVRESRDRINVNLDGILGGKSRQTVEEDDDDEYAEETFEEGQLP
mmetsp:Transcript_23391/g.26543  ORF Transcript_23391/g.26543 Transcript_23391/m.26543 type:complete len:702 (+) Transcript_23391:2-2107(+)